MLAADCEGDVSKLKFTLLASPKIDGIRCVVRGGKALTRSLKPVPNKAIRERLESEPKYEGIDGELVNVAEPTNFQRTSSAVMGRESTDAVEFWAFDRHDVDDVFVRRNEVLENMIPVSGPRFLRVVPQTHVGDEAELAAFEAECLAAGYEGVMLRDPNGKYKHGRSTLKEGGLVKLKRFVDAEAVIVGFEERMHNTNEAYKDELGRTKRSSAQAGRVGRGDLGAFVLEYEPLRIGDRWQPIQFTCGSGLTDAQRVDFWKRQNDLLGKLVKYKYLAHGMKDLPRHPVFLGIRDERDL